MSTRADRYTQVQKLPDLFSDFLTDLTPHPITRDLTRARNEQSIKQSVRNLILTNYGERPFQPMIGSSVYRSLFEPDDDFLAGDIEDSVRKTIEANEPRVSLVNVAVETMPEQNSVSINIVFVIINTLQPQSLEVILRRVR